MSSIPVPSPTVVCSLFTGCSLILAGYFLWQRLNQKQKSCHQCCLKPESRLVGELKQEDLCTNSQGCSMAEPQTTDVKDDQRILRQYPWNSCRDLPSTVKEALEPALLKELLLSFSKNSKDNEISHELCAKLLNDSQSLRKLLLQCWERGSFQALLTDSAFLSAIGNKNGPLSVAEEGVAPHSVPDKDWKSSAKESCLLSQPTGLSSETTGESEGASTSNNNNLVPESPDATGHRSLEMSELLEATQVHAMNEYPERFELLVDGQGTPAGPYEGLREKERKRRLGLLRKNDMPSAGSVDIYDSSFVELQVNLWKIFYSDNHESKIPEWLSLLEYWTTHNDIIKKRTANTGKWFIQSKKFLDWCTNPYHRVLWCPGIPGVGKTVLASLVIDHLRECNKGSTAVGFIYFSYKSQSKQSLMSTIQALSRQMHEICSASEMTSDFDQAYLAHMKHQTPPSEDELKQALSKTCQRFSNVYVVLDALDEYLERYNNDAIDEIVRTILSFDKRIKLMVTSRPITQMEDVFGKYGATKSEIIANEGDLATYLKARMTNLNLPFTVSEGLSNQVVDKVRAAAKGRFLMAELHMNSLANPFSPGHLKDALEQLPDKVDETYARVMDRIKGYPSSLKELVETVIMWITHSRRPLTYRELQHALATKSGKADVDDYTTPLSIITSACAGIIVIEDEKVGFVHFTAQQYFEKEHIQQRGHYHREITRTCLDYLHLPCFINSAETYLACSDNLSFKDLARKYPFYNYAALSWGHHANACAGAMADEILSMLREENPVLVLSFAYILEAMGWYDAPGQTGTRLFLSLYHCQTHALLALLDSFVGVPVTRDLGSPFLFAAQLGQADYIRAMLDKWCNSLGMYGSADDDASIEKLAGAVVTTIATPNAKGDTALEIAARHGQTSVVKLLLEHQCIDTNSQGSDGGPSLTFSSENGYQSVVEMLLKHPDIVVNRHPNPSKGATALMSAAANGHESVVKVLLEHQDVDVNCHSSYGITPLMLAAQNGHKSVVKLIIGHPKIDVNLQASVGFTALHFAAQGGHCTVVMLLLEHHEINPNRQAFNGATALVHAAQGGHESVARALLEHPAIDVNLRSDECLGALMIAAFNGHESVVKLLLHHPTIDVNPKTDDNTTPLIIAARNGHDSVVKLLLTHPMVDVNSYNKGGTSALIFAAQNGQDSVVQLLLEQPGINVNWRTNESPPALICAASEGHVSTVRLLLACEGINPNLGAKDGATALCVAALRENDAVTDLLLEHRAIDPNSHTPEGETPLFVAAKFGHGSIVKRLLEQPGINVNLHLINGLMTPLMIATHSGHESIVKLLLDHPETNVNAKASTGATALAMAAGSCQESIVELILGRSDVDVNSQTKEGATALIVAASGSSDGHESVVKALLRKPDINVNVRAMGGRTALLMATTMACEPIARLLLDHPGIDANLQSDIGSTPLICAAIDGCEPMVKLLLERPDVDVNSRTGDGATALIIVAEKSLDAMMKMLLERSDLDVNARADNGATALILAVQNGHESVVKLLLGSVGLDVRSSASNGRMALYLAAQNGHDSIARLLLSNERILADMRET